MKLSKIKADAESGRWTHEDAEMILVFVAVAEAAIEAADGLDQIGWEMETPRELLPLPSRELIAKRAHKKRDLVRTALTALEAL